jgi:dihydrodipicolinate synthase/N-acetylneuraminate lyase
MDLYIEHAKRMLDAGCSALAPFGTTGEALSVGMDERMEVLAVPRSAASLASRNARRRTVFFRSAFRSRA